MIYSYLRRRLTAKTAGMGSRCEHWIAAGDAARAVKDWNTAAKRYRKALKVRPDLTPIWVQYGHALKESGRTADAETAYRRARALASGNADTHLQLGHLKKLQGNIPAAVESYKEALRRDHDLIDAVKELKALGFGADVEGILGGKVLPRSLAEEINSHFWWHSIDLGNGIVTPGRKTPEQMAAEFRRVFDKIDLVGKSVLDVGAWNGGFSVEAARRGAARVVALDHYTWNAPNFRGRETFDLVNSSTGLGLEAVDIDLDSRQLSLSHLGSFDVVLFLGVFYHLKDPLAALREVSVLTRELLVMETYVVRTLNPRPAMVLYPGDELNGDPTNWWGPNTACVMQLLSLCGFMRIEVASNGPRKVFHAFRA